MEKGKCQNRQCLILDCRNSPYFPEYERFLGPERQFGSSEEDLYFFYSYSLSRTIQDTVEDGLKGSFLGQKPPFEQFCGMVMENEEIEKLLKMLKSRSKRFKRNNPKDRKTSFFRMIVKRLKKISRKTIRQGSYVCNDTLAYVQDKLSHNTISKESVEELMSKCGSDIVQYLESDQAYSDILNVNKSKINKAFYLLHLKELAIQTRNGRLPSYSFFLNCSWNQEIKNIIQVFFNERWQNNESTMNTQATQGKIETSRSIKQESMAQNLACSQDPKPIHPILSSICEVSNCIHDENGLSCHSLNEDHLFDILVGCQQVSVNFQEFF